MMNALREIDRSTLADHLARVLKYDGYDFTEVRPENRNAATSFVSYLGDATIRVDIFPGQWGMTPWAHIEVAFGEVRRIGNCPMADGGIVSASSEYREPGVTPAGGSALPGYDLIGLKWRVSGVAPKSRSSVIGDGYIQTVDIIAHLLGLREKVADRAAHPGDSCAAEWNDAEEEI